MNTKLVALRAELDLAKESYQVVYNTMITELDDILDRWFVQPFNAKIIRRWFREDFFPTRTVDIQFEVGFHNEEENRTDFGSDMSFSFNQTSGLTINYGTCGTYSKTDIYQVRRVKTIAFVWDHVDMIETEIKAYAEDIAPTVIQHNDNIYALEREISRIEQQIAEEERVKIEQRIVSGATVSYSSSCALYGRQKLFFDTCTITKVTPKFVTLETDAGREYKLRKQELVKHIQLRYIIIE